MTLILRVLSALAARLPLGLVLAGGRAFGWLWYHVLRFRRAVALDNLRRAYGDDLSEADRRRIVRAMGSQLGMTFAELFGLARYRPETIEQYVEAVGVDGIQEALRAGKGAIVVSGHLGSWELGVASQALRGLPVHCLFHRFKNEAANRWIVATRTRTGLQLIDYKHSARHILETLRKGEIVAFPMDQNMPPSRGIVATLFGIPCMTTPAPAVFAQRTGAPVFFVNIERLAPGRHRLTVEPVAPPPSDVPRDLAVRQATQLYNGILEARIRVHPEQWLWTHRRFKPIPPAAGAPANPRDGGTGAST
jgi:Kdo2-lipid IVA lauroyltransferase/acyltransferase